MLIQTESKHIETSLNIFEKFITEPFLWIRFVTALLFDGLSLFDRNWKELNKNSPWEPLIKRFQTDASKLLSDWLTPSDSIFDKLRAPSRQHQFETLLRVCAISENDCICSTYTVGTSLYWQFILARKFCIF